MNFVFLGADPDFLKKQLDDLSAKIFSESEEARHFDYESLHANKLDAATLKKALIKLPAVAKQRLVIIRNAHKLSLQNKKLLTEFLKVANPYVVVVLESSEWSAKDSFVKKIASSVKVVGTGSGPKKTVFDMTRQLSTRPAQALKILSELLEEGSHPLQIMGGLVWFWGQMKGRLSAQNFQKGLEMLQEADLNIKRSRLKPENAVEILVVQLSMMLQK